MIMLVTENPNHDKLEELLDLTRENNRILRSMHRRMIWSQVLSMIYWLIIVGAVGWSYYYFQPYFEKYLSTYQSIMKTLDSVQAQGAALPSDFKGILEKVR